jgi:ribosomal-protein-serine acetyltransferase
MDFQRLLPISSCAMRRTTARMPITEAVVLPQLRAGSAILRPWRADDAANLFDAVAASREELGRWLPWATPDYALSDAQDWIAFCERNWRERSAFPFGVFDEDGGAIGGCGINRLDSANRCAALGYWIATPRTGHGFARRAATGVAAFGFRELGLCRIEILILPENRASRRVAEAIGAQWECDARARLQHRGVAAAACVYALLPDDMPDLV